MGVRFWWSASQHLVMALRLLALVSWLSVAAHGQISKIKDDLKQCANSGQDLNSCLTDLAVAIKPYMKAGVPELGIPQADPLILDEIAFDLKNPIIDVHVEFTENEVTGLSEHELLFINADKDNRTIEMSMFIPASKSVDKFLNQNTDKFIKDFQPAIAKSVSGFLKGFYNGAVSNIDISVFQ